MTLIKSATSVVMILAFAVGVFFIERRLQTRVHAQTQVVPHTVVMLRVDGKNFDRVMVTTTGKASDGRRFTESHVSGQGSLGKNVMDPLRGISTTWGPGDMVRVVNFAPQGRTANGMRSAPHTCEEMAARYSGTCSPGPTILGYPTDKLVYSDKDMNEMYIAPGLSFERLRLVQRALSGGPVLAIEEAISVIEGEPNPFAIPSDLSDTSKYHPVGGTAEANEYATKILAQQGTVDDPIVNEARRIHEVQIRQLAGW